MRCDGCAFPPAWKVYAAYDVKDQSFIGHKGVVRYPRPMVTVCHAHLIPFLIKDKRSSSTTGQWVIKPIQNDILRRITNDPI